MITGSRKTLVSWIPSGRARARPARDDELRTEAERANEEHEMTVMATTTSGTIRGAEVDGIKVFKGVPYAAPPVGARRFRPPARLQPWDGVREALEFSPICPQPRSSIARVEEPQSEDCLHLHVWTPGIDDAARPVMVWFHGGGFQLGSGSEPTYHGENLARRGDVVVVTVNHRLGPLGYLHLGEILGEEFAASGNNGMLDLVQSLEWVRDNAANFGGDPDNVTIFGESGGGMKVSLLHVMPRARGLFHRAIVQSGAGSTVKPVAAGTQGARKLLDALGMSDEDARTKLWELPVETIVNTEVMEDALGWSPVLDGTVVAAHPRDALADGTAIDVPMIIGSNADEYFGADIEDDEGALRTALARYGEEHVDAIIKAYRTTSPEMSPKYLARRAGTDSTVGKSTIAMLEHKAKGTSAPVWTYLFTFELGGRAGHGYELPFVFNNLAAMFQPTESRQKLADEMSDAWIALAHNGDPNHPGLPEWPSYDPPRRSTMTFNRGACEVIDDPWPEARELWYGLTSPGIF
ncbi:MAG TPA: carboxylesterase/lipase family protein [Acidimicrobiia bacterium]|nr:carboxylesterase/lipase family protein [Acidimicrobiia bacterium]